MILICPLGGGINSDHLLLLLSFWCLNCPSFDLAPSSWLLCPFQISLPFFSISLPPSARLSFRLILYSPCPAQDSDVSPRSPTSFYCAMEFRNQDLVARCAHCCWDVAVPRPELRHAPKYTTPITSTAINSKMVGSHWRLQFQPNIISFSSFTEKPGFCHLQNIYLFGWPFMCSQPLTLSHCACFLPSIVTWAVNNQL